jgi:hypothetical protein
MKSGLFHTYIATGFFAILIFFILNSHLYTPLEMLYGTILVTILLKAVSNIMFSLVILLYDFKNTHDMHEIKIAEDKLDLLVNEMQMREAELKSIKIINDHKK